MAKVVQTGCLQIFVGAYFAYSPLPSWAWEAATGWHEMKFHWSISERPAFYHIIYSNLPSSPIFVAFSFSLSSFSRCQCWHFPTHQHSVSPICRKERKWKFKNMGFDWQQPRQIERTCSVPFQEQINTSRLSSRSVVAIVCRAQASLRR